MSKNIRRGRTGTVICASCGQVTRRDRAVYTYKDGIKVYYCPDCAKKVHIKLYKGIPHYVRKKENTVTRRKFVIYQSEAESTEPEQKSEEVQKTEDTQPSSDQKV